MAGYGCPLPSFLMFIAMVSSCGFAVWRERQTWRHVARQLEEAAAGLIPEIDIRERVSVSVAHDKAGVGPIERPGRREAARCYLGRHSTLSKNNAIRSATDTSAGSPRAAALSARDCGGNHRVLNWHHQERWEDLPHARCNRRNRTGARVRFPCFGRW